MNNIDFTFSDTIAGYVTTTDWNNDAFGLRTTDGREYMMRLSDTTQGQFIRNPPDIDNPEEAPPMLEGSSLKSGITPGKYLFAYGIFYPEHDSHTFEAKAITFLGEQVNEYHFETPDWWVQQIHRLADFYLNAQFPDGTIDYRNYRTDLTVGGHKFKQPHYYKGDNVIHQGTDAIRQETATMSRMIYGFASTYLLTGEDRYLQVAEKGTEYLREYMRTVDEDKGIAYWYHAIDIKDGRRRKIFTPEGGDDYHAIPAYEQIYALVGLAQTYRVTGDPRILSDIQMTINLFNHYFLDRQHDGYFSHVDPINLDPRAESLRFNRARKNWNSIGDHIPAYLINLWLATGESSYADRVVWLANLLAQHCPDYEHSPFMLERFHEDWSPDLAWDWQQNRAVVGHNLKLAWNLLRIHNLRPNEKYTALAQKIAEILPTVGMDRQRGAWYDVMERTQRPGEQWHRFVWHDRKAWWQQEQAILAYLILYGVLKKPEYLQLARESASFYNAFFPDHDSGGIYFNVLDNGVPYLLGNERLKGNHAMSSYHSFELCYLATVYGNLLIKKQPMNLYFKPKAGAFKDNLLRVQPDILPPGSIHIGEVWLNGEPYSDFDSAALTVKLPPTAEQELNIRVCILPKEIDRGAPRRSRPAVVQSVEAGKQ
jgi:mannose/cellobiose epimerase-like protein (N-acyl-D-glucosamine 2-epimerase family)